MTSTQSERGKLLSQYVCARIIDMTGINIGLFDFDRNNSLYYFALNADEQIYLRYGGRDAESAETYLDFDSLNLALTKGLELHEAHKRGELPAPEKPKPLYPRDIPLLKEEVLDRRRCVECHLIGDYTMQQTEWDGALDKLRWMYRSPDPKTVGIHFDVPKGLAIERAEDAAAEAGMQPGDVLTHVADMRVYTFGDFQYQYDKTPRDAESVEFTVERNGAPLDITMTLPLEWWLTDLYYRFLTVEPLLYAEFRPLDDTEKEALGLPLDGFASEVTGVDTSAQVLNLHTLEEGDIVYEVAGIQRNSFTKRVDVHIKLEMESGIRFNVRLLRNGEPMDMSVRAYRQFFRKAKL